MVAHVNYGLGLFHYSGILSPCYRDSYDTNTILLQYLFSYRDTVAAAKQSPIVIPKNNIFVRNARVSATCFGDKLYC